MRKLFVFLLLSKWALASVTATYITSVTGSATYSSFTGYVGNLFTVGSIALPVTSLGRRCWSGNSQTHQLFLMTTAPASVASVSVNMAGCTPGQDVFGSVSVTLSASTQYYCMSGETSGGDAFGQDSNTATTTGDATLGNTFSNNTAPPSTPSGAFNGDAAPPAVWGPCNFKYTTNSFTSTQTGNWASASTWGGIGVPGSGDRCTVAGDTTVTVAASTTATFGTSGVATTVDCTVTGTSGHLGRLIVAGTLDAKGDLQVQQYGTLEIQGDGRYEFDSPSSTSYRITYPAANNGLPYPLITSTATSWTHPAVITNKSGNAGDNGTISQSCCDSKLSLAYTKLINLGKSGVPSLNIGGDFILDHVLITGSGQMKHNGAASGYQVCWDYVDIRTPTDSPIVNAVGPLDPSTCNRITHSVLLGTSGTDSMNLQWNGLTMSDTIIGIPLTQFPATKSQTWNNVLMAQGFTTNGGIQPATNSSWLWNGGGFWVFPGNNNAHQLTDTTTAASGNAPNAINNLIINGNGDTGAQGDLILPVTDHYTNRLITVNRQGNLDDGYGNGDSSPVDTKGTINHTTSHLSDDGGARSTVALAEFSPSALKMTSVKNLIADSNYNGLCIATGSGTFVAQTNFTYDYIWLTNRQDPDPINNTSVRPWNAGTNHQGSICDANTPQSKGTITVTTHTDDTHLIVSSTAAVAVGDEIWHAGSGRGAFVLAIPSSQHITLGFNEDGVAGLPSATAGQSLAIIPNIWSSGVYGDSGKGLHEYYDPPRFIDPLRTVVTWDTANGGPGTEANARAEMDKVNGWDISGNAASWNSAYSITNWVAYMQKGFMPTNLLLKGKANDAAWAATTVYKVGQMVLDPSRHLQLCITAGTSGSGPTWNDLGGNTTDGTVTWQDQGVGIDPGPVNMTIYNAPGITGGGVY